MSRRAEPPKPPKPPKQENGAALLTVLLLVAVMATIAAIMLDRVGLAARLAANSQALTQARFYALAAESVAIERVAALVQADQARTVDNQGLLGREFPIPFERGNVLIRADDAGNCFNLNSLVEGQDDSYAVRPVGVNQFVALMEGLEIDRGTAEQVAHAAADWIDSDQQPEALGAEDGWYQGLGTPYRTPDALIRDVSELRAIRGVTPVIYDALRPWICALPVAVLSPINVNTIRPEQARLIQMLAPQTIGIDQARSAIASRPALGFAGTVDFWRPFALDSQTVGPQVEQQVQVRSRWFRLDMVVDVDGVEVQEQALIDAQLTPARLVHRQWGEPL